MYYPRLLRLTKAIEQGVRKAGDRVVSPRASEEAPPAKMQKESFHLLHFQKM